MNSTNGKRFSVFGIGVTLMVLLTVGIVGYYFFVVKKASDNYKMAQNNLAVSPAPTVLPDEQKKVQLLEYKKEDFGFSVGYAKALHVNDLGAQGGYTHFVRFEQEYTSKYEGFAIGVSQLSMEKELGRIKSGFAKDDNSILEEEKNVEFKGLPAKSLHYKPKSTVEGEGERVVIVVYKDPYTYSLSTTPEEMPALTDRFSFIQTLSESEE